jgi:hypothetical protein
MRERVIKSQADPSPYPLRGSYHKNTENQPRKSFLFSGHYLKVPKCEIFDPFFFTIINPIWVGD